MKKTLTLSLLLFAFSTVTLAQTASDFENHFQSAKSEMTKWDPIRGEWLAQSMINMASNKPTPDRNFPEDFTPAEMYNAMPAETQRAVRQHIATSTRNYASDSMENQQWARVNKFVSRTPNCKAVMGRTYGDPHLSSFDNATYAFQTVGEFTLVESGSGHMKVQVRQRNQGDDFSLNTATAMWVDGDRVCFYPNERPDGNTTTPLRIEGQAVYIDANSTYYLEHGGTITKSKNDYVVTWPTGEKVQMDFRQTGGMNFMNIAVQVFPCTDTYDGILGNANGNSRDDYSPRGSTSRMTWNTGVFGSTSRSQQELEKEYLAFLAKDYARSYRITPETSLFDYGFNQSTFTFTDESFPRVHHTIGDLSSTDMNRARKVCERQGVTGTELSACIYDQGFLRIEPTPKPTITDRTAGRTLRPVTTPTPNVNPGQKPYNERYAKASEPTLNTNGSTSNGNGAQPLVQGGGHPVQKASGEETVSNTGTANGTKTDAATDKDANIKTPIDNNTTIGSETSSQPTISNGKTGGKIATATTSGTSTTTTTSQPASTTGTTVNTNTSSSNSGSSSSSGTIFKSGSIFKSSGSSGNSSGTSGNVFKSSGASKTSTPKASTPSSTPVKVGPSILKKGG